MNNTLINLILIGLTLAAYAAFLLWYGGRGKPLTAAEIEALLSEMRKRAGRSPQAEEPSILREFRELAAADDGREFVMVNLLRFREKADYPPGSPYGDDPMAANDRYNRAVVPLLLKRGGHPIFAGKVAGRFIHPAGADDWDQAALVRYRSRRDMLKMAIGLAGRGADAHKWAALEKTQVFPVKPFVNLTAVRGWVAALLLGLALLARVIVSGDATSPVYNLYAADTTQTDTTILVGEARPNGRMLSAFFGLDNALPVIANRRLCPGANNMDGMPVIFDREVDVDTVQAGDFRVLSNSGRAGSVHCVTMLPAADPGELRTVLLVGEFGSAAGDPPVTVEIAGNLLSKDNSANYKGARIMVTPLAPGPTLILAEIVPQNEWRLGKAGGPWGTGSGCPGRTKQALRVVWAGGVDRPDGEEAGDAERMLYRVAVQTAAGATVTVTPFALADLGDGDNNHLLCLDVAETPRAVSFPAGHLVDPNKDLNPDTSVNVATPGP